MKIKSKNELFLGMEIEKPRMAMLGNKLPDGERLLICPYCCESSTAEECDVMGAEDGCLFCNNCNREFEVP